VAGFYTLCFIQRTLHKLIEPQHNEHTVQIKLDIGPFGLCTETYFLPMQKNCKQCPACGMAIERSEGCNKMTCTSCGVFFCYRCNQQIDGYKHYWNGNCILFDLSEIERWEAEVGQQMM